MGVIHCDARCTDDERREALYRGDLFIYSPMPETLRLIELARGMIEDAFAPHDPRRIDRALSMEDCAAVLTRLKPAFIHHPECKALLPAIIRALGGDPEQVYFDVPWMRSAYPTDYLTSGIAYAFHPHRDSWYSAPLCQVKWWMPIYEICGDSTLAFYPRTSTGPSPTARRSTTTTTGTRRTAPRPRSTCARTRVSSRSRRGRSKGPSCAS